MVQQVGETLLYVLAIDFGIQIMSYIPSAIWHTEKFYDLSGSLTYITCTLFALLWRDEESLGDLVPRQIIAASFVLAWCSRLGFFLFKRVLRTGEDTRFKDLKTSPIKFLVPWFMQAIWIFLTPLPVFVILGNPGSSQERKLIWSDIVGIIIWAFGYSVEALADYQKSAFKEKHPKDFCNVGIWKYSRYANYFGEITLWIGMFVLCAHGFVQPWQWFSIISPIFVFCLLNFVSGIPLLEKSSKERYGSRADYQQYVQSTSKLILWPPKKLKRVDS